MSLTGPSLLFVVLARAMLVDRCVAFLCERLSAHSLVFSADPTAVNPLQSNCLSREIRVSARPGASPRRGGQYAPVARLRQHGSSRAGRVGVGSACVVCGAGLIGCERSYCRDCRLELSVLWRVNVRRKLGLPR